MDVNLLWQDHTNNSQPLLGARFIMMSTTTANTTNNTLYDTPHTLDTLSFSALNKNNVKAC